MAREMFIVIKEANLTNNCPECFNQELKLTFYQKHTHSPLINRTTKEVTHEIKCKKCHSEIYPVTWTQDIERVYKYYQKMISTEPISTRYTSLFYALTLTTLLITIGIFIYLKNIA